MKSVKQLREEYLEGKFLLINKDISWTSFDVVGKIRSILNRELGLKKIKVGHAGTLDPLATGLMIVCTGKFTKRIQEYLDLDKEYHAVMELGKTTPSYDLETAYDRFFPIDHIDRERVAEVIERFRGIQMQTPPVYSAKNIAGSRAYEYARRGKTVHLDPVKIEISDIELLDVSLPRIRIRILCSKGTYIRVLAHDIGSALNSGAHLVGLERTRIGKYRVEEAESIKDFEENLKKTKQI